MRVTICELADDIKQFEADWNELVNHTTANQPELVLLPELAFSKWIADEKTVDEKMKQDCVKKHEEWLSRIEELNAGIVVYTKPVFVGNKFHNTCFAWIKGSGHKKMHTKYFFPQENFFWEASWFDREDTGFELLDIGGLKIGVLICTEIWFTEYARKYGKAGVDILLCPRASPMQSTDKWIRCGQTLAVISGAYCLSSNKSGTAENGMVWGGNGWIAEPMTGELLNTTNNKRKFVTAEIDLKKPSDAKKDYPLYVSD